MKKTSPEEKVSREDYESIDLRLRNLERWVNAFSKHTHEIEATTAGEVVI